MLAVAASRPGLSCGQLMERMPGLQSKNQVHVELCKLVTEELLRRDGTHQCTECGSTLTCYRISDQGRIYLANRGTPATLKEMEIS